MQVHSVGLLLPLNFSHHGTLALLLEGSVLPERMSVLTSFADNLLTYSEGSPVDAPDAEAGVALSTSMEDVRALGLSRVKPSKAAK